jgi:hypothetical protein
VRGFPAQRLLPGEGGDIDLRPIDRLGEDGGRGIGKGEPAALQGNPVAVGHAHARRGAVPGEQHIALEIDALEVGQLAVLSLNDAQILELQLLGGVGDPALAEAFPRQRINTTRAQHRPHGQLESARVGGWHDGA